VDAPPEQSCDLHVHTTASDGLLTPLDIVRYAAHKRLRAIGIADHDTVAGLKSLASMSGEVESTVEIVPAVELNSEWKGRELHILGYYVPLSSDPFSDLLSGLQASRRSRIVETVRRLDSLGMPVEESRVFELALGESVGRPHIAEAMLERGYVTSIKDAFDRFLGIGRPAYVERFHLYPTECVRAVRDSGGVAVWAHPGTSRAMGLLESLVKSGLQGIEAYHPEHDERTRRKCLSLAEKYHLIATGGSDFHGAASGEGGDLGSVVVPYEVVQRLKEAAGR
jgi:predicted metal-dependent phosphoesterase TrpH